uniref:glycoside hydrolase family 3 C-terminal domain-containing protein n=1 Tax=Roseburia inulinivorans TaxID=360807 RepID=UPI0040279390
MEQKEKKEKKKAWKKAKHKACRPWKGLSVFTGIVTVLALVVTMIFSMFDNTISVFIGGTFWELKNKNEDAQYFKSTFDSKEEKDKYEDWLCEQVEAEGATLLMNKNNALPLEKGSKVSTFSSNAVNLVYGGTGSGSIDVSTAANLKSSFTEAGFEVNETLWNFYLEGAGSEYVRTDGGMFSNEATSVGEVPWDVYTDEVKQSVAQYGDAAIVTFSRVGGEGADLEFRKYNYLELSQEEKDLLANLAVMKQDGTVNKIIVLINAANTLQLDFLQNPEYDIDACMWIGDVGETGINAVADILAGDVTPSGRLADTYCYNVFSSPAMVNFGTTVYADAETYDLDENSMNYIVYQEGIYVGYRYYETRYEDYAMGTGNAGDFSYASDVAYPFGYGLSYTDFEYSNMSANYNASTDMYEVTVTVTNTGDTYSGKETVQIYSQSPYTEYDKKNGVEKASVTLCGFGKTDVLAPGQSETLKIDVEKRDLASYDAYGAKTYILDDGDYYLIAAKNAHDAVNNVLAAKGYTPDTTENRMDSAGNAELTYKWTQETFDNTTYAVSATTGYEITNQFEHADINLYDGLEETITYLSRNDWEGTYPTEIPTLTANEKLAADLAIPQYDAGEYDTMEMPTMGADNGLVLYDMMGVDYDDPKWNLLLDQITFKEMDKQIGDAIHWTMPIESIEAMGSRDENGPQGLTASLMKGQVIDAIGFTSEDIMAATFNREIMSEVGRCIGEDCLAAGVSSLYGPGNNIHRTPFSGRNFEYYSEDGYLSGEISAVEVAGIEKFGVDVLMKHFALNDCEENRLGLATWANEQSIREIYLKAFQAPVEDYDANGVMTAYARLGTIWAGGNYNLITNVLCNEWGCTGRIITDNCVPAYMNYVDCIMAGGTFMDAMMTKSAHGYENDPVIVNAMREAVHKNLYCIVNSNAMNGVGEDTKVVMHDPYPVTYAKIITGISAILFVACMVMYFIKKHKFVKENGKKKDII